MCFFNILHLLQLLKMERWVKPAILKFGCCGVKSFELRCLLNIWSKLISSWKGSFYRIQLSFTSLSLSLWVRSRASRCLGQNDRLPWSAHERKDKVHCNSNGSFPLWGDLFVCRVRLNSCNDRPSSSLLSTIWSPEARELSSIACFIVQTIDFVSLYYLTCLYLVS